jgi:hypothetical protein
MKKPSWLKNYFPADFAICFHLGAMQRKEWFELHDHKFFPRFLRDLFTDGLEAIWNQTHTYRVVVPRLRAAMEEAGTQRVVDLCSGGGGPWIRLRQEFTKNGGAPVSVSLTDKYPNAEAIARMKASGEMSFHPKPVNAMQIPDEMKGFRTIFSSFHHFGPAEARAILADAASQRQGIAVFDAAQCNALTLLAIIAVPFITLYATPGIRPFRWSRIIWTYLLPVVPLTLFIDGILSCLRSYSPADMRELTEGLGGEEYHWEIGEEQSGKLQIAYLIGRPRVGAETGEMLAASAVSGA